MRNSKVTGPLMKIGVIVTGLPASGKTTIAREIAKQLNFELLDKDDFLEKLFQRFEVHSVDDRKQLSRQSDRAFQEAAVRSGSAVLVSHWRRPLDSNDSGTPAEWLAQEYTRIVEVVCQCPPKVALKRFLTRKRHSSHLDTHNDPDEIQQRMAVWANRYPLGIGTLVEVQTDRSVNISYLIEEIRLALLND